MSTPLSFGSNTLTTYVYEPFSYTITNPDPGTYTLDFSKSSGIPNGYIVNYGSNVVFSTPSNGMSTGAQSFTVTATSGSTVLTSSNKVNVNAGRFLDAPSGASYDGRSFTFYKSEPIPPIPLVAPFAINIPTAVPTLPPGLTYTSNASNIYSITGTPLVTVPQSNYLFIGKATGSNLGKIVTSKIGLSISNERVLLNLSGTPIVSPMVVGTAISQRVLTAAYPPYPSGGTLRYSWSGLPDGIVVKDNLGNTRTSPFTPTLSDASSTLIITGTPTINAANAYRDALITSNVVTFTATRTNPLPQISNSQAITFAFGETVLFDTPPTLNFYNGVALDPSTTYFRAQTYFEGFYPISNMTAPGGLPSGLTLTFESGTGRGYLGGTPTVTGTNTYTIRAVNSNNKTRDISVPITVAADSVTFGSSPAVDVCYNFVLSRPSSLALTGYYPSNIQFTASAASGKPVTFSAPALAGTGLSFSNVGSNTIQLVGTPNTMTPLTTVTITASATGTPATATRDFKLAVLNDVITIADVSSSLFNFVQNRTITPIQFSATTLSERSITSFAGTSVPAGLTLSPTGLLTGTPTGYTVGSDTFTVTASTGFASQNKVFTYNTVQDNVLVVLPMTTVTVPTVFSNVEFDIVAYSGAEGQFSQTTSSPAKPFQSTNATFTTTLPNFLSGNFSPPSLAPEYRFTVIGEAGTYASAKLMKVIVNSPPTIRHSAVIADNIVSVVSPTTPNAPIPKVTGRIVASVDTPVSFQNPTTDELTVTGPDSWFTTYSFSNVEGMGFDMARNSNVFVAVLGSNIIRSVDYGNTWSQVPSSNITTASNVFGMQYSGLSNPSGGGPTRIRLSNPTFGAVTSDAGSNWWAIGVGTVNASGGVWDPIGVVRRSIDNGQTWVDVSLSSGVISAAILSSNKLFYNQGRLFYTGRQATVTGRQSNAFYYADVTDITNWTKPFTTLGSDGSITGLGFSNSTVFAAGDDSNGTATFVSTNNGTNWSTGTNPNPGPGVITDAFRYADIFQKYGFWFAAGMSNGFGFLSWSSNLTAWNEVGGVPVGTFSATTENGITWASAGPSSRIATTQWTSNGTLDMTTTAFTDLNMGIELKRLYADTIAAASDPTLTMSIIYDTEGVAFTSPTTTSYTNWQFVPIPTIPVEATNPVPNSFLYYYVAGLPRGLTLNLDASGIEASITGTSSQFSDTFQRVTLYAVVGPKVGTLPLGMRTILPTVQKQQTSAGAWTSLVRQYTVVNAAQNSINGKALPSTEPPLGEFTRPEPPDSVNDTTCKKC